LQLLNIKFAILNDKNMKPVNIFLLLIMVLFALPAYNQVVEENPKFKSTSEKDLGIHAIRLYDDKTVIEFTYTKTNKAKGDWIYMAEPGEPQAMNLQAKGIKYKLVSKTGIGSKPGITQITYNKTVYFVATFEPLPKGVTKFDLTEGEFGGDNTSWSMYGVKIPSNKKKK
jgi:hypothetical protein